jgi:hypothetical protein
MFTQPKDGGLYSSGITEVEMRAVESCERVMKKVSIQRTMAAAIGI